MKLSTGFPLGSRHTVLKGPWSGLVSSSSRVRAGQYMAESRRSQMAQS